MNPMPDVLAAGAVLWRPSPEGPSEVAVVHRPRYDDWSLPKGKLHPGESFAAAAAREVLEETGHTVRLGARLGDTNYRVEQGEKVVRYWGALATGGAFEPNDEVDELRWLAPDPARELLSYAHDVGVLDRFRAVDPPPEPLLLVRHAKAGDRASWVGDDQVRPLTDKGREQAAALVQFLALFGPARAYSAPPVRCVETLRPLTDPIGLAIGDEPSMSEHGYAADPEAGFARLLELAAAGPGVAVVCSQGAVIPDLITRLTGRSDPPARKGSTWVLTIRTGVPVAADYYPDPYA